MSEALGITSVNYKCPDCNCSLHFINGLIHCRELYLPSENPLSGQKSFLVELECVECLEYPEYSAFDAKLKNGDSAVIAHFRGWQLLSGQAGARDPP